MSSIVIIGTGALACLFAARLTGIGIEVTMLGTWVEGLAALNERGVLLEQADGSKQSYPVRATSNPTDCAGARQALVLVKAWQTSRSARFLVECLSQEGIALSLQNGMGNREKLASALGSERVALGTTTSGATLLGPGHVRSAGEGVISVGAHPRIKNLTEHLRQAGFNLDILEDLDALLWGKLVVNAAINPLTALLRVPNGELVTRPSARVLSAQLAREAASVAEAAGIELPFQDPVATAEGVAERTAANKSSMFQDVLRGAPTEIDAICGELVKSGEVLGIPTPINAVMWRLVKALTEGTHG
jgi:2-dehydropantoate 2-reductase